MTSYEQISDFGKQLRAYADGDIKQVEIPIAVAEWLSDYMLGVAHPVAIRKEALTKEERRLRFRQGNVGLMHVYSKIPRDKWVSYQYLAFETGFHLNTIRRHCNRLKKERKILSQKEWKQIKVKRL